MDARQDLLTKIDLLIAQIDAFYENNKEDCRILHELSKAKFKIPGPYGNVTLTYYDGTDNPLKQKQADLNQLKQKINSSDFTTQGKRFEKQYEEEKLECEAVCNIITSPAFLLEKQKKYARTYLDSLFIEFKKLHDKLTVLGEEDLLNYCDINIQYLQGVLKDDTTWKNLSKEQFTELFSQYETRKNEIIKKITELKKELSDSNEAVNKFNSEFSKLQSDCKLIRYIPIPVLKEHSIQEQTKKSFAKNNSPRVTSIQEKIDMNMSHIEENMDSFDAMTVAVQEYINNIKQEFPSLFVDTQSTELSKILIQLRMALIESDDSVATFNEEFNFLHECYKKIDGAPPVSSLPALQYTKDAMPEEKIRLNDAYIKNHSAVKELMSAEIQNYIKQKTESLLEKAKFSQDAEEEVSVFLEQIKEAPLSTQIEKLKAKEVELKNRIEEADRLAIAFVNFVQGEIKDIGFNQLILKPYIDSVPELKALLKNNELENIPLGFLLCIKDMTLWNPKPSLDDWRVVVTAGEGAIKKEPWARKAADLYQAIYKYPYSTHEGNADFEAYKSFKQSICTEIFTNKQLVDKKSFIETQALEKLPHKNVFLRWLDATIKWLELKATSSTSIGIFGTKTQKELRAELNKILSSEDQEINSDSQSSKDDGLGRGLK